MIQQNNLSQLCREARAVIGAGLFLEDDYDIIIFQRHKMFYALSGNKGLVNSDALTMHRFSGVLEKLEIPGRNWNKLLITRFSVTLFNDGAFITNIPL